MAHEPVARRFTQFSESDFDRPCWRDCHIWGIAFRTNDPSKGDWISELVLDIDFSCEWKLEKLDVNGDTADGEYSETRRLVATVTQEGREGQRVIHDAEGRTSIRFRKIDGEWFID